MRLLARLLRIFYHLLYHQFSWTYDWVAAAVSMGMWQDWIKVVIPYLDQNRILEIGHGPGHLQLDLHQSGRAPIGLDRSPQMGRHARRRLRGAGLPNALFRAQAQHIPLPDNYLDQIVATFPTEYIAAPQTQQEIWRTLKPGGQFIILPTAIITGHAPWHRLAAWLFRVTGQSGLVEEGLQNFCAAWQQNGFITSVHKHTVRNASTVYIIVAEKA